ncbi:MAG: hypothetical protein WCZ87_04095 [Thiohalobacteraceae bacterium]
MDRFPSIGASSALYLSSFFLLSLPTNASALVISEILYDAISGDAGNAFVELFGAPGTDLSGWSLQGVNGADGSVYKTVALSGVVPLDGVFVVADPLNGGTNVPNAELVISVDFQNGPDSVQLYNGDLLVDAIGYGSFGGLFFAGEGQPAPDPAAGSSLARVNPWVDTDDNLADFAVLTAPTPGTVPVSAVPLPASLYLLGAGLMLLGSRRQARTKPG